MRRWLAVCAAGTFAMFPVTYAPAAPLPEAQTQVSIVARDQPIGAFIRDLFGRIGRPVVPSPNLTGTVNGTFNGSADKVFSDIAKAFNLVGYNDGAAIYIYGANELTVQTLAVGQQSAQRTLRQVAAQRLSDARNIARASADGTLVVSGTPRFVEQVTTLARGGRAVGGGSGPGNPRLPYGDMNFGAPPTPLEFRVFYLRYARAEDTSITSGGQQTRIPGVATILQNLVLDHPIAVGGSNGPSFGARLVRQSQNRLKGRGLDSVAPDAGQTPVRNNGILGLGLGADLNGSTGGNGGMDDGGTLGGDGGVIEPVRIQANPYLNAIIVRDAPERMQSYDTLIRALDVEPQLVEIEATIIDIDTDKLRQLGINWRLNTGGFGALFGDGSANDLRLLPAGDGRRQNVANITPQAIGGTISTIIGPQRQFLSRITALETQHAARIVSRPQIMTLSNVEALFDRTQTFYVRVAGSYEVDLFNVTTGITLRVNPHVFRDKDQTRIKMLINIQDGSLSNQSSVDQIPVVEQSDVATQAMVVDGESLLLGGLTVDSSVDDETRLPGLGKIPLLGELFKNRGRQRSHVERLFLITPRVAVLTDHAAIAASTIANANSAVAAPMPSDSPVPVPAALPHSTKPR